MAKADADDQQLFLSTVPQNIVVPQLEPQAYFGILDVRPDTIKEPPRFTEPATLEAMSNLGILSYDLVPKDPADYEKNDISLQIQVQIELERRRLATFEKIITERQLILNRQMGNQKKPENEPARKKRRNNRKNIKNLAKTSESLTKTTKRPKAKSDLSFEPREKRQQKLPSLIRKKKINASAANAKDNDDNLMKLNTNRRVKTKSVIDLRMQRASITKKRNEEAKVNNALNALKKVEAVEQRKKEMRMKQQALIKEKAQIRMERLAKKEARAEANISKRKEVAKTEMMRQEQQYSKIREREMKKYEKEHQKRMQKVYGQRPNNNNNNAKSKSSLAELRKKLIASKLSFESNPPKQTAQSKPPSKISYAPNNPPKNNYYSKASSKSQSKNSNLNTQRKNISKNISRTQNLQVKPIEKATFSFESKSKSKPIVPAKGSHIPCFRPRK